MTRLCLVRHGQTDWNLEGRYQGQSDVPLNAAGCAQAQELALRLQRQAFDAVYSSPLGRARQTAEVAAGALGLEVQYEKRLCEIHQGEWEGQLVSVIQERYEDLWRLRTLDPAGIRPPGGETVDEVAQRVCAALDDITRRHPRGCVLVVSHGLALAAALCRLRGIPLGQAYGLIPDNADPLWVDWEAA